MDKIVHGVLTFFFVYLAIMMTIGCLQEVCWKLTSTRQMTKISKTFFKVKQYFHVMELASDDEMLVELKNNHFSQFEAPKRFRNCKPHVSAVLMTLGALS